MEVMLANNFLFATTFIIEQSWYYFLLEYLGKADKSIYIQIFLAKNSKTKLDILEKSKFLEI